MSKEITSSIRVNQWKNSSAVIKWFRNIENKPDFSFIIFDIQDFYSSISLSLFNRGIEYGKETYNLSNDEISIIMQSRKTLLFSDGEPWVNPKTAGGRGEGGDSQFDPPPVAFRKMYLLKRG